MTIPEILVRNIVNLAVALSGQNPAKQESKTYVTSSEDTYQEVPPPVVTGFVSKPRSTNSVLATQIPPDYHNTLKEIGEKIKEYNRFISRLGSQNPGFESVTQEILELRTTLNDLANDLAKLKKFDDSFRERINRDVPGIDGVNQDRAQLKEVQGKLGTIRDTLRRKAQQRMVELVIAIGETRGDFDRSLRDFRSSTTEFEAMTRLRHSVNTGYRLHNLVRALNLIRVIPTVTDNLSTRTNIDPEARNFASAYLNNRSQALGEIEISRRIGESIPRGFESRTISSAVTIVSTTARDLGQYMGSWVLDVVETSEGKMFAGQVVVKALNEGKSINHLLEKERPTGRLAAQHDLDPSRWRLNVERLSSPRIAPPQSTPPRPQGAPRPRR